jgi:hypothetical protein
VTEANIETMKPKIAALAPQFVRIFFNADAFGDADLMKSFDRTLDLAQATVADGGAINATFQGLGPKVLQSHPDAMKRFADKLADRLEVGKVDKLRWVTLRNEPNGSSPMDKNLYAKVYRDFDGELTRAGIRSRLRFMGGDLLQDNQRPWFKFIADNLADLMDAYSIHVYWDYRGPEKIDARLKDVREVVDGLGDAKKPLYVMESGVRGITADGEAKPGHVAAGALVGETNLNGFQRAWFALQAVRRGFRGVVAWDAYFSMYDNELQRYSLIGPPADWTRRPAFRALRLLTLAARPGWKGVVVEDGEPTQRVVGFTGAGGELSVASLDTRGAQLDGASQDGSTYEIHGLPPNTSFQLCFWNHEGDGLNSFDGHARSDGAGVATFEAPLQSVFVLTTLSIS